MRGHGNRADIIELHIGLSQGLVDHWQDAFDVSPRRNLGNDTPKSLVQFVLSGHNVRQRQRLFHRKMIRVPIGSVVVALRSSRAAFKIEEPVMEITGLFQGFCGHSPSEH
jgi:hypothetical protein